MIACVLLRRYLLPHPQTDPKEIKIMEFMVPIENPKLPVPITYKDRILLVGSCFTEHIGNSLRELKFSVMQNPHGILFDPASVCNSLVSYVQNRKYTEEELFQHDEVWHSWGMALGETKLPKSIVSKPTFSNELMYSIFFAVGIMVFQPCMASRGHSMNFNVAWSIRDQR